MTARTSNLFAGITVAIVACFIVWCQLVSNTDTGATAIAASPATQATDVGTELVVAFYNAILQDDPLTLEQELSLFKPRSAARDRLIDAGVGKDKDPVLLTYFREHKEWFVPVNLQSTKEIQISTTARFARSLAAPKDPPQYAGDGFIVAIFVHDRSVPPDQIRWRTVYFRVENGRLNSDIDLDGINGRRSTLNLILDGLKGK